MNSFCVYKITNLINDKIYIGKTNNLEYRWRNHLISSRKDSPIYPIHRAIKKYGKEKFSITIIESDSLEELIFEREKFWITYYKTNIIKYGDEFGYNLTDGGEGSAGHIMSEEGKEKLRQFNLGKKYSLETKKIQSLQRQGENNNLSKLTDKEVAEIKGSKLTTKELEIKFKISRSVIQKIRSNKLWSHIDPIIDNNILEKPQYNVSRKLNNELAAQIKYSNLSTKELVTIYKVNRSIIQRIRSGKIWNHI